MNFKVDLRLFSLHRLPLNESEEEPYIWTFFFQLDASTVKQLEPGVLQLVGNVKIVAGYGGHGNLSSPSPTWYDIPDNVGTHQVTLRPIRLQVHGETIVIPGRLVAICVLLEEDATSDKVILEANAAVRDFLELKWNHFLTHELNQHAITTEVASVRQEKPDLSGRPLILEAVERLFFRFGKSLGEEIPDVVEYTVLAHIVHNVDFFELFANAFDHDDFIGDQRLVFDEKQIISAGLEIPIHSPPFVTEPLPPQPELFGSVRATLTAGINDLVEQTVQVATARLDGGGHLFESAFLCIEPGTRVEWTLNGWKLEENIRFTYPFLDVRWSVGNIVLAGPSGTVEFSTDCDFPKFDPSQPPRLLRSQHTQRQVKVHFEIQDQGDDGKLLKLWNDPEDGNYSFIASAVGLAGNNVEIPLGHRMVTFTGQKVELGPPKFVAAFNDCLKQIESAGERYAKSKKINLKDLWDPQSRFKVHEEMIQVVDNLAAVRGLEEIQISILKEAIAKKLRVKPN